MEKFKVTFKAENQQLNKVDGIKHASDTYADIEATFILGERWTDMDSVSAVWWNDFNKGVTTVLDSEGKCIVPHEVLTRKGCVRVNLVGSVVEGDELVTRLTSYSAEAVQVNEKIKLTGSESEKITPSEYEQFVANVKADADRAETAKEGAREYAESASDSAESALASAQASEASALRSASSASESAEHATASANSAEQANTSAQNAEISAQSAETAKEGAEDARDEIRSMRANAETLEPNQSATASYSDGVLTLGIPRGQKGDTGEKGDTGDTGATPNFTIGTVETLEPNESATATITGDAENPVLNLGIPQGKTGEVSYEDLESLLPKDTASGDIISIPDGQSIIPVESLKVTLEPIQDLHGYDKPWAGGAGKNLFDANSALIGYYVSDSNGALISGGNSVASDYIDVTAGQTYMISPTLSSGNWGAWYDENKAFISGFTGYSTAKTAPSDAKYLRFTVSRNGSNSNYATTTQVEKGSEATAWTPYSNIAPISGWTDVDTYRTGKNLFGKSLINGYLDINDILVSGQTYTVTARLIDTTKSTYLQIQRKEKGSSAWSNLASVISGTTAYARTFTADLGNYDYSLWSATNYIANIKDVQIELGSTATDYAPYQGDTYHTEIEGNCTVTSTDKVPYLLKEVSGIDGDRLREKIIGGTVNWNQMIEHNMVSGSTQNGITTSRVASLSNGTMTATGTATANAQPTVTSSSISFTPNHIYYLVQPSGASSDTYFIRSGSSEFWSYANISKSVYGATNTHLRLYVNNGQTVNLTFQPQIFDLTQMFGTTIADYIYSLEQTTAGAGVAWFKKLFPNDYYAYDAGSLKSVQTSAHVTKDADDNVLGNYPLDSSLTLRGIPKLADGSLYYDGDTYEADGSVTRNIAELTINGSEQHWYEYPNSETELCYLRDAFYAKEPKDMLQANWGISDKMTCIANVLSSDVKGSMSASTAYSGRNLYVRFPNGITSLSDFKTWLSSNPIHLQYIVATPTTEQADPFEAVQKVINGGTEEYIDTRDVPIPVGHETEYLSRVTYGCTIDLVSGECVIDRAMVDLGDLTWIKLTTSGSNYWFRASMPNIAIQTSGSVPPNLVCSQYETITGNDAYTGTTGISSITNAPYIVVVDMSYTDATAFKTAMNGVQLVYELATPQTIQLSPQEVKLLLGTNNVWSDGTVTMVYSADTALWVQKKLGQ